MPDQDRKPSSFLSQGPGEGVRCPICPGLIGGSFQADCVCCGRQVATQPDSKADDLTKSVKALSIKTEVVYSSCPKTSHGRQIKHRNIPLLRRPGGGSGGGGGGGDGDGVGGGSRMRMYQQLLAPRRGPSRLTRGTSVGGAHHVFKGVRTRRGVKGYLVEIRPPKWKKTIWLGTYNTSIEAAGAYDAGVFYTKKANSKYNFQSSEGAFPPLPSHLHLDGVESMEEIKLFVQNQARQAARRIGNAKSTDAHSLHEPASSESCITGDSAAVSVNGDDDLPGTSSSEQLSVDSEFHNLPMDLDYLGQCLHAEESAKHMFLDYTNYLNQQGAPDQLMLLEEEEIDNQLN